jgi:hypothetical protein
MSLKLLHVTGFFEFLLAPSVSQIGRGDISNLRKTVEIKN